MVISIQSVQTSGLTVVEDEDQLDIFIEVTFSDGYKEVGDNIDVSREAEWVYISVNITSPYEIKQAFEFDIWGEEFFYYGWYGALQISYVLNEVTVENQHFSPMNITLDRIDLMNGFDLEISVQLVMPENILYDSAQAKVDLSPTPFVLDYGFLMILVPVGIVAIVAVILIPKYIKKE